MNTCSFYYISLNLNFKELCSYLQNNYKTTLYRDVIHIHFCETDVFVFEYGSVVFWNTEYDNQKFLLDIIKPYCKTPIDQLIQERVDYVESGEADSIKIVDEVLTIQKQKAYLEKLACSYAFAQSINLDYFENSLEDLVQRIQVFPKELQKYGKIKLPRTEVSKLIGEILTQKHSINLHFNLLEKPDFFWEYEEFEKSYMSLARYQEIDSRVDIVNKKLTVLEDTLDILVEEKRYSHSTLLEWIVILLIVIEVVLSLLGIAGIIKH